MSDQKRVIVTGATGLIGKQLFAALKQRGYAVVVFSRNPEHARATLPGAAEYVAWSAAEDGPWVAAVDGAEAVIHLGGAPISAGLIGKRWTREHKADILNSREIGTRGISNAICAASRRPRVLLSASGIGYYGFRDATPIDEDAPAGNDFLARVCIAWEREAARAEEVGVRVVRLRTGIVLDPHSGALDQMLLPFRMMSGGPIMPGTQYYSWIHPADQIGLMLMAIEDERVNGPLNATAPNPETSRDFASTLGKVLGSPSWLAVPEIALQLALGEMSTLVTTGQRALPHKAQSLGYQFRFAQLEPALRDLLGK